MHAACPNVFFIACNNGLTLKLPASSTNIFFAGTPFCNKVFISLNKRFCSSFLLLNCKSSGALQCEFGDLLQGLIGNVSAISSGSRLKRNSSATFNINAFER